MAPEHAAALSALRALALEEGLTEVTKWGQPCFMSGERNICLLGARRDGVVLSFLKGALLDDPEGLLRAPGEASRSARVVHVSGAEQVSALRAPLRALLARAVEVERAGLRVAPAEEEPLVEELRAALEADEALRVAFEALTPGRRRGYHLHVVGAKQPATRAARVERCRGRILAGVGLEDCDCGLSRRPPRCDGSHKRRGFSSNLAPQEKK